MFIRTESANRRPYLFAGYIKNSCNSSRGKYIPDVVSSSHRNICYVTNPMVFTIFLRSISVSLPITTKFWSSTPVLLQSSKLQFSTFSVNRLVLPQFLGETDDDRIICIQYDKIRRGLVRADFEFCITISLLCPVAVEVISGKIEHNAYHWPK